jgi:hypothetical protein
VIFRLVASGLWRINQKTSTRPAPAEIIVLSAKGAVFIILLWTEMRGFRGDRGLDKPDMDYVYFTSTGRNSSYQ